MSSTMMGFNYPCISSFYEVIQTITIYDNIIKTNAAHSQLTNQYLRMFTIYTILWMTATRNIPELPI